MNTHSTPFVSIVIPTYNHARYLSRALQSVLDQTFTNWEAIVVDNHSTDNTDEVMANFSDPRIHYLKIHNNGIIAASRNMGIRAAKGEWIAFLDSDDWWTKDKLQVCCNAISDKVDLLHHDLEIISDKPRIFRSKKIKSWQVVSPALIDLLSRGNAIATSSAMVRTSLLRQLNGMNENPEMVASEDYNTWLRIAELTEHFKYIPQKLGFYYLHNQGISKKNMSIPVEIATADFIHLLNQNQKNKHCARTNYADGKFKYRSDDPVKAKKSLIFSLKYGSLGIKLKSLLILLKIT